MRGLGFFELLAPLPDNDARYAELAAGFLVFRVANAALRSQALDEQTLDYASQHVRRVADLRVINRLRDVLEGSRPPAQRNSEWRSILGARLHAYGVDLHGDGLFPAALDIFELVAETMYEDDDLRLQALARRAWTLRLLKRFDQADATYATVERAAARRGRPVVEIEALLGRAKVAFERGNVPASEMIVTDAIHRASAAGEPRVLAKARIDAARIAGTRNQPLVVLEQSFLALEGLDDSAPDSDHVLRNISIALRELGRTTTSRQVALHVAKHARNSDQRLASELHLYHLAIDEENWAESGRYRTVLSRATVTPGLTVDYWEAVTRHRAASGNFTAAKRAAVRMLTLAEEFKLAEMVLRADSALADIARGVVPAIYLYRPRRLAKRITVQRVAQIERELAVRCPL